MKTKYISIQTAVLAATLAGAAMVRANTVPLTQSPAGPGAVAGGLQVLAFSDSAEAQSLRNAYVILATGDHDYKGHRVGAMKQVKAAADLLGLNLSGDDKDRQSQALSDDKLRAVEGLINQVLGAAEVKSQKRVVRHLNNAIEQINVALSVH